MIDWEAFYNRFRQPDFVPGYEIGHRLGGGAFGDVYLAKKRSIGKPYAIKFLKLEAGQHEAVERELEHVRLFAQIDHPNLVTIEDMGVVQGVPYLILGYAGEDTLARRLKRGDLTREGALSYFVQACRGVLALHDRKLAHFDLKPSNIFIKGEVARVGDYGLARLLADGRATLSFGRGTPHYMAPEMLRNRADHRADLYSLGVILYESTTGALPYPGDSQIGLVVRESDDPPAFPSDYPVALRRVVERCLRLEPAQRYSGVNELLSELGQSARQGDSVVIPWTTGGQPTRVPIGSPPSTPRVPPRVGAGADPVETKVRAVLERVDGTRSRIHDALRELAPKGGEPAKPATPAPSPEQERRASEQRVIAKLQAAEREAAQRAAAEPSSAAAAAAAATAAGAALAGAAAAVPPPGAPPPTPTPPPSSARSARPAPDIISFKTLDEPDEPGSAAEGFSSAVPSQVAAAAAQPEPPPERIYDPISSWEQALVQAPAQLPSAGAAALTIPVPPRVEGGLARTVYAVFLLGLEVLLTLIYGPLASCARSLGTLATQVFRGVPGAASRLGRLVLWLLVWMLAGGLLTALLVLFLKRAGGDA